MTEKKQEINIICLEGIDWHRKKRLDFTIWHWKSFKGRDVKE